MKKSGIVIFCILATSQVFAATSWKTIAAIGGGITNTINLGEAKTFPIMNPIEDEFYHYSPSHKTENRGLGEVFLGIERPLSQQWLLQAGLAYTQSVKFQPQGKLIQGADVQSQDEYYYQFNLVTRQVMLQTKWMYETHHCFYPYALLGLGMAINTSSDYITTAPYTLTYTRLYEDKTDTSFAYRLGVGIDVDLAPQLRAGIAYRIANIGASHLGQATIDHDEVSGTLSQSAIYANEVLAQLTWRF